MASGNSEKTGTGVASSEHVETEARSSQRNSDVPKRRTKEQKKKKKKKEDQKGKKEDQGAHQLTHQKVILRSLAGCRGWSIASFNRFFRPYPSWHKSFLFE